MPGTAHLRVELLGDLRVLLDGEALRSVDSARLQSLLAYLVLYRHAPQRRQHLAFVFWPESTEKQARTNLRQLLHHLRNAIPGSEGLIEASAQVVQWRADADFVLDVDDFEKAVEGARSARHAGDGARERVSLSEAVNLYRGDLLPGCYEGWIEPERARLRDTFLGALEKLVLNLEVERSYSEAIGHAKRLVREDALREASYRTLMMLHAENGDRASALRTYHECCAMLERELGVDPAPDTVDVYERLTRAEVGAAESPGRREMRETERPDLVGRGVEWERIQEAWRAARKGRSLFILISGVAGIGKTRLAEEQLDWCARTGFARTRTRCYAAEGRLAYGPVTDWLRSDAIRPSLNRLDPATLSEVARVVPELSVDIPGLTPTEPLTESWQRRRFFEAMARAALALEAPASFLIDDLQWCDRETLEWLRFLLHFDASAPLLVLGTARSEEVLADHPLRALLVELDRSEQLVRVGLSALDRADTVALARQTSKSHLSDEQVDRLVEESEGVPLFVVEQVRVGSEARRGVPGPTRSAAGDGTSSRVPPRVRALIESRLAQLSAQARELAALAATIGRDFQFDVLAGASELENAELVRALDELWHRRIIREHGSAGYDFSHDRLREAAYDRVSAARRRLLHRRVATALEALLPTDPNTADSLLALHFERAGEAARAIEYYQAAAGSAQRSFAHEEAILHLRRALGLLEKTPASPERDDQELALQSALGRSLVAARGYAATETGEVFARALPLAEKSADLDQLRPVLWGLHAYNLVRVQLHDARKVGEVGLGMGARYDDSTLGVISRFWLASSLFHLGELGECLRHLVDGWALERPPRLGPFDPGTFLAVYRAHVLWHLGDVDEAMAWSARAQSLADDLDHPMSQAVARAYAAMLHQFEDQPEPAAEIATTTMAICDEYGMTYYGSWAAIIRGWSRARLGAPKEGIEQMEGGLHDLRCTGARLRLPYYLGLLAEAHADAGATDLAHSRLSEALATVHRTQERWCEPELLRLQGTVLRQGGDRAGAEDHLRRAVEVARRQGAKSLQQRATLELAVGR